MAGRSMLSRVFCTPAAQVFCSSGFGAKSQLSFASSSDRENAGNFPTRPSGLTTSSTPERYTSRSKRPSVCRIPQIVLHEADTKLESAVPAGLETTRAALQGSFETQAAVGRVECTSRGCRPIFDDALEPAVLPDGWLAQEDASEVLESRTALYHSSRSSRDLDIRSKTHFPKDFAEFLNEVWMEKGAAEKYFEVALRANPFDSKLLCEYASFSWKSLNDADKAEGLYKQALEAAPDDADIIASYALFLWQSDS